MSSNTKYTAAEIAQLIDNAVNAYITNETAKGIPGEPSADTLAQRLESYIILLLQANLCGDYDIRATTNTQRAWMSEKVELEIEIFGVDVTIPRLSKTYNWTPAVKRTTHNIDILEEENEPTSDPFDDAMRGI